MGRFLVLAINAGVCVQLVELISNDFSPMNMR